MKPAPIRDAAHARSLRRLLRKARPDVREFDCARVAAAPALQVVGVGDCSPGPLRAPRVRAVPLGALGPAVREPEPALRGPATVGADRLAPLPPGPVRGRSFVVGKPVEQARERERREAGRRPRKAYREHRVPGDVLRQTLTTWDLLLPMLQPPLALEQPGGALDLPHRLYHYQVDGIRFLCDSRSALLADEMGTGKTVMSTVAMRVLFREGRVRRALVVCPLSVIGVWDRHLADWAPELAVTVVHGGARTRWADWRCPAHVYLTTFDTLRGDVLPPAPGGARGGEPLCPPAVQASFDLVLLDEAQSIKNRDSGRTRAVLRLAPKLRWALSGTPVENRLADLQSLFAFLRPRLLPEDGLTPQDAAELVAPFVKRRTKRDVMKELPPKIRQDEWLELDPAQRRAYRQLEDRGVEELEGLGDRVTRVHVFTLIGRLKMLCNFVPGRDDSPKLRATVDKVQEIRDSGKKVLIFSQFVKQGVDRIAAALAPYGVVTFDARLSQPQREAAVARFRDDPSITAFVATVKSAGVGLTLTEASYVIHFDHWWNPAWMWQAEDRAHRRGQTEPVNVYSLWMAGTIEERVHELLSRKGILHETVIDGLSEGAIDGLVSVDEWLAVLRPGRRAPRPNADTAGELAD
ncbi:MAG: DEAD/DEAH box helicase [Planctomycetes bacterium]|nr:DEAD/DEAH box helicase [Planctomycetota bacterium]